MLLVQEYLKSGKSLENLKIEHGINYHITNGKISLNYNMIDSKETDELAQQCRGLILSENNYDIIACPMFRFFNKKQECAAEINWDTAKILLKLDGTMLVIYNYQNQWYVGTRSRAEANVKNENDLTFFELTEKTVQSLGNKDLQDFMSKAPKENTYIFELTTPLNQVYIKYNNFNITLLAVRNNITLTEDFPENYLKYFSNIETVESYSFSSIDDLVNIINSWNPKEKEGVVVRDNNFNRIKLKHPGYEAMSHLRDSLGTSIKNCIKLILMKKDDDIIGDLPDVIRDRILELKEYIKLVKEIVLKDYEKIKNISEMKEFANNAEFTLWPAAMYAIKRGKVNNIDHFLVGGNKYNKGEIPSTAIDGLLIICEKIGYKKY